MPSPNGTATAGVSRMMNGATKTVLVVEDNELNMKLFHDLLEAHGYNILQTKDGMEAMRLAREHHPDLILMDIQMPEMDGLEATRRIREMETRENLDRSFIVSFTADVTEKSQKAMFDAGCDQALTKPIKKKELLDLIEKISFIKTSEKVNSQVS